MKKWLQPLSAAILVAATNLSLAETPNSNKHHYVFSFATGYVLDNINPSGEEVHFEGEPIGHIEQTHDRLPFMYIWNAARIVYLQNRLIDHLMFGATFSYYPTTSQGIIKDEDNANIADYTLTATSKTLTAEAAVIFKPLGHLFPFIHGNVGATRVTMGYNQNNDLTVGNHSNTNFAYKIGAGFMFPTTEHTQVYLTYTHIDNGKLETNVCDGSHCLTERLSELEKLNLLILGIDFLC